jgi:hypothetical protein
MQLTYSFIAMIYPHNEVGHPIGPSYLGVSKPQPQQSNGSSNADVPLTINETMASVGMQY